MRNRKLNIILFRLNILAVLVLGTIIAADAEVVYAFELEHRSFEIGTFLQWGTSFERDSDVFYIEKSRDGLNFHSIGELAAAGVSDKDINYRFLDPEICKGKLFYRLKLVEKEGVISYSRTIVIDKSPGNKFQIAAMSGTVGAGVFFFTLDILDEGWITYFLYNADGKLQGKNRVYVVGGLNEIDVDISDKPNGIYKISFQQEREVEGIVIRKNEVAGQYSQKSARKPTALKE